MRTEWRGRSETKFYSTLVFKEQKWAERTTEKDWPDKQKNQKRVGIDYEKGRR